MPSSSRVGTPQNLSLDGTHDILLFTYESGFPQGKLALSFGQTPRKITGVQKVAQVFTKILMTPAGSDPIRPSHGTDFLNYVMGSNLGSEPADANLRIRDAISSAETQTKALLQGGRDYDSQLRSATMFDYEITGDTITMFVKIITSAGTEAAVAIPFPQTDLQVNA